MKREVPRQAAENWKEALRIGIERDEEALRSAVGVDDAQGVRLGVGKGERQEEVERAWGRGIEGLERLKREMPGETAKMERAKRAAEYALAEERAKTRRN